MPAIGGSENSKRLIKRYLNDFFSDLSPGNQVTTFKTDKANFVPLICYEVIFSGFVAEVVNALEDPQVLLVQSNNGWFGETRQPYQHLGASVLRSVENRLPLVHVMNNGPSAVVLPSGRKLFQSDRGQESGYLVQMPVSDTAKTSFYTRNPYSFLWLLSSFFLLMLARSLMLYKK